jgi:amino acid transporter
MLSENAQTLLVEYRWLIQVATAAAVALMFGWLARRGQPKTREGWRYSYYPVPVKILAVLFAAFMTTAIAYNGMKLFASDWWVPPIIILMFVGAYWLLYEVFITRLRWNDERFELRRYPFGAKSLPFSEIVVVKQSAATESLTVVAADGRRAWFPYSYRVGMGDLLSRISQHHDETAA